MGANIGFGCHKTNQVSREKPGLFENCFVLWLNRRGLLAAGHQESCSTVAGSSANYRCSQLRNSAISRSPVDNAVAWKSLRVTAVGFAQ